MAEEEKQEQEETTEAPAEEAPAEEPAAEEEAPAEEPAAEEEAPEEEETPTDEPAAEAPPAEDAPEPEEVLSPKELRKRERSRAFGEARPQRTPEERAASRGERRQAASQGRRRHRASRRGKRGEPAAGTPKAAHEPGPRKVRQGTVVSAGGDKTITVRIAVARRHPTYEKVVRRSSKLRAHDEQNQAQEGDVVSVVESRPLSRTKRWRLLEVLEKAR